MNGDELTNTDSATSGPKLWVVLARAYGALAAFVESRVAHEGLCLSDFMVMEVLLHKGPMTISCIGEKVLLAGSSMTAAVDRLERRGFAVRQSSPNDRRARLVDLTPEGRVFIQELYTRHESDIETLMAGIGPKERSQLRSSLKKIGMAAELAVGSQVNVHENAGTSQQVDQTNPLRKGRSQ